MVKRLLSFGILLIISTTLLLAQSEWRLFRFPAIYDSQIVFTYAGDLYTVSVNGGIARKLTSHAGYEMFPRFSPDGKYIAFTAQYDGNTEVYIMPAEGGAPKRLTYTATLERDDVSDRMGPNNIVMCWTPDGKYVVFRSRMRSWNAFQGKLYKVLLDGDIPEELPLPRGGFCSFSPDGKKIAYNRVFREFRTWKRYRGGMTDDIWIYDFETKKLENITNNSASDIIPMWHGDKIYFLSDRDENMRMNLYVYDLKTKQTRKLTNFKDYDIKFPSIGKNAIVFEYGGYIYKFDLKTEKVEKVPIIIADDMLNGRGGVVKVVDFITDYDISPDGKRALFVARGDVFTVPAKEGQTRNLTATSGVHERDAVWSPDGKYIAYISDATGEDEIYIIPQDGGGQPIQITSGEDTYKYRIVWSPDGKKIMWSDRKFRLRYVDIQTKKIKDVAQSKVWEIRQYVWSPDGKWIAYVKPEEEGLSRIYLYSLDKDESYEVTDGWYSSYNPVFSSDGKYLIFVSDRDFSPIYSRTEFNHVYQDMSRIYLITLSKETESPFKPKSDEVSVSEEKPEQQSGARTPSESKEQKKPVNVVIDLDGIKDRIIALPITPSNYTRVDYASGKIYYIRRGLKDEKPLLFMYDLNEKKETELGQFDNFIISFDGKKMLVVREKTYVIIDLPKAKIELKETLKLDGLEVNLDRHAEWNQIFEECWRQMREFFYDPNLHGVDWKAVKKKYEVLLPYVNHRADLTYIIGEMIGELNAGHTYVGGGDLPKIEKTQIGLLGAEFERDKKSGYYRIKKILKGQNWDKNLRSPLTEVGVNVKEDDYIIAVNGKSVKEMKNIYESLINTVGKQVRLRVNSQPKEEGSREVTVVPIGDETRLYYYNWVQSNIEKVNKATGGKVGYIHIPDMGIMGLNEFVKHFYPQLNKKALIIDVRGNGGGNVSPMIIERLRREIAMVSVSRYSTPTSNPRDMHYGPKICIIDEFSASDGDIFPYRFKKYGLGKLVGKRTWGGVIGIRGTLPLVDGGYLNKPEFAVYGAEGEGWIIEGYGVEPDVYVDNDPAKEYEGIDVQLNKAIELILEELKTGEKKLPPIPPYPKK